MRQAGSAISSDAVKPAQFERSWSLPLRSSSSSSRQLPRTTSLRAAHRTLEKRVTAGRLDVENGTRNAEQAQESFVVTIKVIKAVAVFRKLLRNRQQRLGLPMSSPSSPPLTALDAEKPTCPTVEWDELKIGRLLGQGAFTRVERDVLPGGTTHGRQQEQMSQSHGVVR